MRIRGVKSELEKAGEDTEGMVENTAKLQEKIMALTNVDGHGGVNILTQSGDFKSTYNILLEISRVWSKISDTSQASLLEAIAGKTRGSVVAGLLQNGDILEDAYREASKSSGSSHEELNKYLDSIQGKTDILTNSMQTLWNNALNSDFIKYLLDIANGFVKIVDNVGLLKTALTAFFSYKAFTAKDNSFFDFLKIFNYEKSSGFGLNSKSAIGQIISGAATGGIKGAAGAFTSLGIGAKAAAVGTQLLNSALTMGLSLLAGFILEKAIKAIDNYIHRVEILKEEVNELKDTYEEAKETFDDNLEALTTSSDTKLYATLQDEFEALARGVDKYGNNISLTSDQYERYKDICEKIISINPAIAAGYDSATEAIGNNVDILTELIELQKYQSRQNADNIISDDNFGKFTEDAVNDYEEASKSDTKDTTDATKKAWNDLKGKIIKDLPVVYGDVRYNPGPTTDINGNTSNIDETISYILEKIGYADDEIQEILSKYEHKGAYGLSYSTSQFMLDYYDEIKANAKNFGAEYYDIIDGAFSDITDAITSGGEAVQEANDALIDDFLVVPHGTKAGEYYDELNSASKKFITEWIKTSDQFKVENNKTTKDALAHRDQIIEMVKSLASEDFATKLYGEEVTAQDLLDKIYNFDMSSVNWLEYSDKMGRLIKAMWNAIGGADNKFGFNNQHELSVSLGFTFVEDQQELQKDFALMQKRLQITADEMSKFLMGLNAFEIQAFYTIDWNDAEHSDVNTLEGILEAIRGKAEDIQETFIFHTYTSLAEEIESYNEVLAQTTEIVTDNTKVTEEYKKSLLDLGITEEQLNECFDENNELVVKDAKALKKLVDQTKKAKQATLTVAKAQAQLEYSELVAQIRNNVIAMGNEYKAYGFVTDATFNNISAMREQLDLLKETISQYALLEIGLSDAANAYTEYEKAKTRDEQLSYDVQFEEMLKTIDEGLLKNEPGSEAFEYAVKAIVPPEVYEGLDDVDAKVKAIHDYIDGNPIFAKLFHVDAESGDLDINADNVREFINMGLANGAFVGDDAGDFKLSDNINGIEDMAEAYSLTEATILAMLAAAEKCDATWNDLLTDIMTKPLDRAINYSIDDMDEATKTLEDYLKKVKDGSIEFDSAEYDKLVSAVTDATIAMSNNKIVAQQNAKEYSVVQAAINSFRGELSLTGVEASALAKSLLEIDGLEDLGSITIEDGQLKLTDEQITTILKKLGSMEEPSIMQVQLRYDDIVSQIDSLQTYIEEQQWTTGGTIEIDGVTITNEQAAKDKINEITAEKSEIEFTYKITETSAESDKSILESYQELAKNGVSFTVTAKVEDAVEGLDNVSDAQKGIKESQEIEFTTNASTIEEAIKGIADQLSNITSKTITLTVNVERNENVNAQSGGSIGGGGVKGAQINRVGTYTQWALGTARAYGDSGLQTSEHNAIVGEIGPELVCDPIKGIYYTVGNDGTEMVNLPKGAIIYNHKQTEELLKNGHTTRGHYTGGLSFASGNAHSGYGMAGYHPNTEAETSFTNGTDVNDDWNKAGSTLFDSVSNAAEAAEEFEEALDWIEVRLEEWDELLGKLNAQLENAVYYTEKNNKINEIIAANQSKLADLKSGSVYYEDYAAKYLSQIPAQYREMAKNGAIAISDFVGDANEDVVDAIQKYRDYIQKAADLNQQAEEILTEIRDLAIQKIDNAYDAGSVQATIEDAQTTKLQNAVDLDEESGLITSEDYYIAMMENSNKKIEYLIAARNAMQKELDAAVKSGQIARGSNEWYEQLEKMYGIDAEIDEATLELEQFQNAINEIHWENFDQLISRIDYLKEETQSLIDLMANDDLVADPVKRKHDGGTAEYWTADDVQWTDEGLASLGLYAQQMEIAEYAAKQYSEAIKDLDADYAAGLYSENEYLEKLNELKEAQYENIEAYYDAQDAIVELNEARIDSIKEGIEKEIDAYSELIDAKKELLDQEKDLYDFQKSANEQAKNIAQIERQLAALANDNSMSAMAKKRQLEAELSEAKAEQEELYYNRSIEDRQNALDQELEDFQNEKELEIQKWEEYLTNVEAVIAESLGVVQANASGIYDTLNQKADEYNIHLSEAIKTPWNDGALAVSDYQETFDTAMSATMNQLDALKNKWQEVIDAMTKAAQVDLSNFNAENNRYETPAKKGATNSNAAKSTSSNTSYTVKSGDSLSAIAKSQLGNANRWQEIYDLNRGIIGGNPNRIYPGQKLKLPKYTQGTTGVKNDQLAWIDEMGLEELVMHAGPNGRLTYLSKGSAVLPSDISSNLMQLGSLDPQNILDRSRPAITPSKSIVNTEIKIDASVGTLLHVEHLDGSNPDNVLKLVDKAWDKKMQTLNNAIKSKVR